MADAEENPQSQSTRPLTQTAAKPAPYISVADAELVRVGDFTFGANKRIDDAPEGPSRDQLHMTQWLENQAERVIRQVLERSGLRLHRHDTWVQVMNRVNKNLYEIFECRDETNGGWHIYRKGKLVAKISYPYMDYDRHWKFRVS